jgi:hypothetical protein
MWKLVSVYFEPELVSVQDRCMVCAKCTIISNQFGRTRSYSYVTRLKWKLVSVCLEIVLILTQDKYAVCAECIIGMEIILDAHDGTPR